MSASKVKLPSIAELTNHRRLPIDTQDLLPLLLILNVNVPLPARPLPPQSTRAYSYPPPTATMQPVGPPVHGAPMMHSVAHPYQPYYLYGNVPPPYYLHSYSTPVYYLPMPQSAPQFVPQDRLFLVAEVINKPMNRCHRCGTTETPEWRRGPNGLRTLCNACGLFHAKLVKRKGAALAAAEVLNNKVCKGKNGRRVLVKKQAMDETKKRMREAQVTEIPPISYQAPQEYAYGEWPRVALPPPVVGGYLALPPLRN